MFEFILKLHNLQASFQVSPLQEHLHRGVSNDCAYGKILTNRRSYVQIGLDIHQLEFQRLCIWKLPSIYDVEGWRTRLPRTHTGLPCVPIHMHILNSFPRWTCHAGCAYGYANFAQAVQISKICTVEESTVHFFFHMHRIFHPMDLRFSRYVQIFHMHSHRWRWSDF